MTDRSLSVNDRLGRVWRGVRRWRGGPPGDAIAVAPDLPDQDWRHIQRLIDETVSAKGGEVAARRRARTVAATYRALSSTGRLNFLRHLARGYGRDRAAVDEAIEAVTGADGPTDLDRAEARLREVLEPRREQVLRRLGAVDDGLGLLVGMRAELLPHRRSDPALAALERNLKRLLESWFDVALLGLHQLTWDSPASLLERLIEYEAVHAITSWEDLKRRLGPGRRCYAFIHPGMPDDPLIFVEVALTRGVADDLGPLLDRPRSADRKAGFEHDIGEDRADTAIFYSISNCHTGLAGVSLGDFLIKSVVNELSRDLPGLKHFVTLSPIPGFRDWIRDELGVGDPSSKDPTIKDPAARARLLDLIEGGSETMGGEDFSRNEQLLTQLAARYLVLERRSSNDGTTRARDGVAHFHLSNGAIVDRLNWRADESEIGWTRGLGMMVNYRYRDKDIERNHDRYVEESHIAVSDDLRRLVVSDLAVEEPGV